MFNLICMIIASLLVGSQYGWVIGLAAFLFGIGNQINIRNQMLSLHEATTAHLQIIYNKVIEK